MIGKLLGAAAIVAASTIGFWAGHNAERRTADDEMRSVGLADSLGTVALCANGLTGLRQGTPERVESMLQGLLDSSLDRVRQRLDEGATLGGTAVPSLKEGLLRAAAHYESVGDESHREEAEALHARLQDL